MVGPTRLAAAVTLTSALAVLAGLGDEGSSAITRSEGARTIATIRGHVAAFGQNESYLGWLSEGTCALRMQKLGRGGRTRVTRGRKRGCGLLGVGGLALVRDRAYWDVRNASLSTEYSELRTASLRDPKVRTIGYQSHAQGTSDQLLPPASDGRGVYFWTSPGDSTDGPVVRYDGLRRRGVSDTETHLRALAGGDLRYGRVRAIWAYDCADAPAWSPDGTRIAYTSTDPGRRSGGNCKGGLWVIKTDGSGERRIADVARNPDWAPDGSRLAYEDGSGVAVISADGGDSRLLVPGASSPSWSPDGTQLAFARGSGMYVAAADGSGERLVTSLGDQPDWSPDGGRLVFSIPGRGLRVVNVDGSGLRSLTTAGVDPAWSPDGRTIAYTSAPAPEVITIKADGSGQPRAYGCSNFVEIWCSDPSWAPDSQRLALVRAWDGKDQGDSHLVAYGSQAQTHTPRPRTPIVMAARGGGTTTITPGGEAYALAVTRETTAALVRAGGSWRIEVYGADAHTVSLARAPTRLAASGHMIVFRVGRTLYALDAREGSPRVVARAAATPIGLSIVGRRIAWAENLPRGARIRALLLQN